MEHIEERDIKKPVLHSANVSSKPKFGNHVGVKKTVKKLLPDGCDPFTLERPVNINNNNINNNYITI